MVVLSQIYRIHCLSILFVRVFLLFLLFTNKLHGLFALYNDFSSMQQRPQEVDFKTNHIMAKFNIFFSSRYHLHSFYQNLSALPQIVTNLLLVFYTNFPEIEWEWQKPECFGECLVKMLLAANSDTKLDILFPKVQFKLVFMHSPVPKLDDSLHNWIIRKILTKSADDYFLKRGLVCPSSILASCSMRLLLSLSNSYSYSMAPR